MKKILILLSLLLAVTLTACDFGSSSLPGEDLLKEEETTAAPGEETSSPESGETQTIDYSAPFDENGYFKNVKASDIVTLPDYKNIEIPADVAAADPEEVEEMVDELLNSYAEEVKILDRAVADGDTLFIDYEGKINGVAFEGGSTQGFGTSVTIGVTNYIPGFLDQLIGHMPGETFDINVTFPETYGVENLNGKDAVFTITIHYISGELIVPTLTDEFVKENLTSLYGFETTQDVIDYITDTIIAGQIPGYLNEYILEHSTISEIPAPVLAFQEDYMVETFRQYAEYYGISLEEYLTNLENVSSIEELKAKYRETNEEGARFSLVFQAISEKEGLKPTEEIVSQFFAGMDVSDPTPYYEFYGKNYMMMVIMNQTVSDFLLASVSAS